MRDLPPGTFRRVIATTVYRLHTDCIAIAYRTCESTASGADCPSLEKSELPEGRATPLDPSPSFLPPMSELRWRSNNTSKVFVLNVVGSSPTALVESRLPPTCDTRFKAFRALCLLYCKENDIPEHVTDV